ncbi:hypothetical protein [Neorhodopirellula pilleata]|uniref:DUF5655 domain-containing protein n=1 Tax=Neorhodopirellula pilleata TaxID=2714738 RepID=A0A5C6AAV0_9BACT|nr:hypothetical protein [Neorhodopirellula pilleata]TWT96438.1 hypothetical protein Pla100_29180 [Neorhodopirellula pilleata]
MTRERPPQMQSSPGWDRVTSFYRDLIDQHGFEQHRMLDVVAHYSRMDTKPVIHASTSHAALGISTAETYPGRLGVPMVYIEYHATKDTFRLIFQKRQGDTERTKNVEDPTAPEALNDILAWLRAEQIMGEQ